MLKKKINKWLAINEFTLRDDKFVWLRGRDQPEGFVFQERKRD